MEQEIQLNGHNKQEYPPMHTAEHILNQTMIRMFGCERSKNTHIERKKSKCDYILSVEPTAEMITEIENRVNEVIGQDLPVTTCFVTREEVPEGVDLSKLPEDASATLRIVRSESTTLVLVSDNMSVRLPKLESLRLYPGILNRTVCV